MKKKIVVFFLVLTMLATMMVPGFALETQVDTQEACVHNWVYLSTAISYEKFSAQHHYRLTSKTYHCSNNNCSAAKTETLRTEEAHDWVRNICKKCGAAVTRASIS